MISVIDERTLSILNQISLVSSLGLKSFSSGLIGMTMNVVGVIRTKFSPSQSLGF